MLAAAVATASVAAGGARRRQTRRGRRRLRSGGTYVKLDGSRVAAVAVPPHTGLVLRKP
jgi:hypothetical protein